MNKVTLIGRLTKDPEVKQAGETTVCNYTLAVNRRYKREGEAEADFVPCVAFGRAAEFAGKWFVKGSPIAVSGRIQTGRYEDKQLHRTVYTWNVVVDTQEFNGPKPETEKKPEPQAANGCYVPAGEASGWCKPLVR